MCRHWGDGEEAERGGRRREENGRDADGPWMRGTGTLEGQLEKTREVEKKRGGERENKQEERVEGGEEGEGKKLQTRGSRGEGVGRWRDEWAAGAEPCGATSARHECTARSGGSNLINSTLPYK